MIASRAAIDGLVRGRSGPPSVCALSDCAECQIRSVSICSDLENDELSAFESLGQCCTFPTRATLFMEGASADVVYNVTSGLVRLFRILPNGRRRVVGFALPGDFLGLPLSEQYGFSADAAELTTACRFPRRLFTDFLYARPHLMRRLYESTSRALEHSHDQVVLVANSGAKAKVAAFLLQQRLRWARVRGMSVTVPLPMGRQDIGDFLGLSISTVSRALTSLARESLILIVPKGVRLLDLPRLQLIAED